MKVYRMSVIDYSKGKNGEIIATEFYNGIVETRSHCPVQMHYSKNAGCHIGFCGCYEYIAVEVRGANR